MWIVQGTSKVIKQQNTLSILSCTEEVTGIPNEAQHTSLFHMLKMPYFPHGASCTRNVTHATQLLPSSTLHSLPKKTYLQQQTLLQSLDCFYCILLSFICMQTWDDNNAHLYSDPMHMSHQELLEFSMCWHLSNILEASGKLSLRFRNSLFVEDVPLLEQLNNCTIKCFFSCCS